MVPDNSSFPKKIILLISQPLSFHELTGGCELVLKIRRFGINYGVQFGRHNKFYLINDQ